MVKYTMLDLKSYKYKKVVELCASALEISFEDLCKMAPERLGQDSCYWLD